MILRARLQFLSAIAAGLASCHPDTPPRGDVTPVSIPLGVPASAQPSATAVAPIVTSAPTIATSVAPIVSSVPPVPSATASATVVAVNPPPSRLTHCPSGEKLQHPCFAVRSTPSTGGNVGSPKEPYNTWDKNGCFQPNEIRGACNGISKSTGPFFRGGQCCFDVCQGMPAPCGRPFVVHGQARVADVVTRTDWIASPIGLDDGGRLRSEAARAWREDAAQEHASIASFARLSLELLAHGAPPTLVAAAHQAALDEVDHARVCFAIATELSGAAVALGPAPLSLEGLSLDGDLVSLAVRAATEGCVGETIAALALSRAAASCDSPALAAKLSKMADDELAHAALAWQCVAWAWGRIDAHERDAVARALTVGEVDAALVGASDAPGWRRLGRLTRDDMREVLTSARTLIDEAKTQLV